MEQYLVLDVTDKETDGDVVVVCEGKTRDEAIKQLPERAVVGRTYAEVRQLGALIKPRERKAVTLSRVGAEPEPDATQQEKPEGTADPAGAGKTEE